MDLAERFFKLFSGLDRAHGMYDISGSSARPGEKLTGRAVTVQEPVTLELWTNHLKGNRGIGIVPINDSSECHFGAIDIDEYDLNIPEILKEIRKNHLPLYPCLSKSGGLHLYLFTAEPVPASLIRTKLKEWAMVLKKEDCEIFPKQSVILADRGDIGQWINMPYFGNTRQCLKADGSKMAPDFFVSVASQNRMSKKELELFTVSVLSSLSDGPPCLETILIQGGFGEGIRNDGIFAIGVYLKQSNPGTWEGLIDKYNQKYFNPPLSSSEVQGVVKSLKRKGYTYTCDRPPFNTYCDKTKCSLRKFGAEAAGMPQLSGLTKIEADPAVWFLNVNDSARIKLSTEELQNQAKFQRVCLETVNILPPSVKPKQWRTIIMALLTDLSTIEVPDDSKPQGRFLEHLETFCTVRAQARTRSEVNLGKVWTEEGVHYFRMKDLITYLERQRFRDLPINQMPITLREKGGKSTTLRINGEKIRVWSFPQFKPDNTDYEVTDIDSVDGGII